MQKTDQLKTMALIVAGGRSRRMGRDKQFLKIAGKPLLEWTVSAFQNNRAIEGIILVVASHNLAKAKRLRFSKVKAVVESGAERQDSVRNGLALLPASAEIVVIHDGARPGISQAVISRSIAVARKYGAALVAVPVKDTIKEVRGSKFYVKKTVDRNRLWAAQTPQTFRAGLIKKVYRDIKGRFTDDAGLVEKAGLPVRIVMGSYENIKVTTPEDIRIMSAILGSRR